ncbi:hypothetical protein MAM1_0030d02337 [Mucor ambiguus]|uniref:Uncharacterized protein n=1 Tax=Mucor ambiguus TaxID=91626 RepID=A0A0C9MLY1_9FUNG|nr:hypothetical protein MAM1_0030d02337 [Mucor ambiguus]
MVGVLNFRRMTDSSRDTGLLPERPCDNRRCPALRLYHAVAAIEIFRYANKIPGLVAKLKETEPGAGISFRDKQLCMILRTSAFGLGVNIDDLEHAGRVRDEQIGYCMKFTNPENLPQCCISLLKNPYKQQFPFLTTPTTQHTYSSCEGTEVV